MRSITLREIRGFLGTLFIFQLRSPHFVMGGTPPRRVTLPDKRTTQTDSVLTILTSITESNDSTDKYGGGGK